MKNIVKKALFIILILIILFSINTKVFAWSSVIKDGDSFIQAGERHDGQEINPESLKTLSSYLYNILLSAGIVVAVVVATVLGIQFMLGGAEGQAKVKEMLVPFIVGCVVVFGGFGFWKIAITVGEKLEDSTKTQYDFSEKTCKSCGEKVNPKFDVDKHTYVCTKCGQPM